MRFFLEGDPRADFLLDSCDVAAGGLFVETDFLPSPGDLLGFELATGAHGIGRVVRVGRHAGGKAGFGLAFAGLSRQERRRISQSGSPHSLP